MTRPGTIITRGEPHSSEAERALLGSILLAPTATLEVCSDKITGSHFYVPAHALIYETLAKMFEKQEAIDLVTMTNRLRDDGNLETVGGPPAVTSLFTFVPTAANAEYYLEIVRRKFIRREMVRVGTELVRKAYEENIDESELLDQAQARLTELSEEKLREFPVRQIAPDITEAMEWAEKVYDRRGDAATHGVATGFYDLDRMTGGFVGGQLIVFAGRPAMGKTALAMNIVEYVAVDQKIPVLVFSLEMSRAQLSRRLLMSRAGISMQRLRDGFFKRADIDNLPKSASVLAAAAVYLDATPALRTPDFKARARRMLTSASIGLIVVDYLQLMKSPSRRAQENRVLELTEITGVLKEIAKELDVPVIALAQLSRKTEERAGSEPRLGDLRESGSIENDADLVGLLYRRYYYSKEPEDEGSAKIIIAKHRDGPPGEVNLRFVEDLMRFQNVTSKQFSNNPEERQK